MKKCVQQKKALRRVLKRRDKIRREIKKQKKRPIQTVSRREMINRLFGRIKKTTTDKWTDETIKIG